MAKSLVAQIAEVIDGAHVLGKDGLRDYHKARTVRDLKRRKGIDRLAATRTELKSYRVQVNEDWEPGSICVHNPAKGLSVIL
jgi:hypothetical protein